MTSGSTGPTVISSAGPTLARRAARLIVRNQNRAVARARDAIALDAPGRPYGLATAICGVCDRFSVGGRTRRRTGYISSLTRWSGTTIGEPAMADTLPAVPTFRLWVISGVNAVRLRCSCGWVESFGNGVEFGPVGHAATAHNREAHGAAKLSRTKSET